MFDPVTSSTSVVSSNGKLRKQSRLFNCFEMGNVRKIPKEASMGGSRTDTKS